MVWLNHVGGNEIADGQECAGLKWVIMVVDKEIWTSKGGTKTF